MTTLELLQDLHAHGVQLTRVDDRLKVSAPKGVLTPEMRAELARQKAAVMALLAPPARDREEQLRQREPERNENLPSLTEEQTNRCVECAAETDSCNDQGEPCCRTHRYQPSQMPYEASPGLTRITAAPFFSRM